jgi:hypothetical protein
MCAMGATQIYSCTQVLCIGQGFGVFEAFDIFKADFMPYFVCLQDFVLVIVYLEIMLLV